MTPGTFEEHIHRLLELKSKKKFREALAVGEEALRVQPDHHVAVALVAGLRGRTGNPEAGLELISPFLSNRPLSVPMALAYGRVCLSLQRSQDAIPVLEQTLAALPVQQLQGRYGIYFCLGDLYDSIGQYDAAFACYEKANCKKPVPFSQEACIQHFNSIITAYRPQLLAEWGGVRVQPPRLLFIVGMPRSGTSLVEQMLDSHPEVQGAGELPLITQFAESMPSILNTTRPYPECVSAVNRDVLERFSGQYRDYISSLSGGKRYVVDKMPGNFRFLGLIQAMFPGSRVIHCRRDPLDTCLSCYFHEFNASQNYSTETGDLGLFYQGYQRLMEHWGTVLSLPVFDLTTKR